jgi:outer membrane murein-binding lipoprotein Lpp
LCAAAGIAFAPGGARADEVSDLKAQVQQLMNRIQQLESKQTTLETQQRAAAAVAPAAAVPTNAVTGGDFPGSFKLPGTNTSVQISGYVKGDVAYDFDAPTGGGAVFDPTAIPLDGTAASKRRGQFFLGARESRFGIDARTPTDWGDLRIFIQGDFYGAGGNELNTNSYGFRLRQAYGQLGPWLIGQTYSTWMDLDTYPEQVEFNGSTGAAYIRQAQVRYTQKLGSSSSLAVAIENPETDTLNVTAPGVAGGPDTHIDPVPDFVSRFTTDIGPFHWSVFGMARELRATNGAGIKGSAFGWGLGTGAQLKTGLGAGGKDNLFLNVSFGDGIGRYQRDATNRGAVFNTATGAMSTQFAVGGFIGYSHFWSEKWRSSATYGHTHIDNNLALVPLGSTDKELQTVHVNLFYSPVPRVDLAVEYIWGRREVESGASGTDNRLQFGAYYRF